MSTTGLDTVIGGTSTSNDPKGAAERFQKGLACEKAGDRWAAIEHYAAACEAHRSAEHLFRLAFMLDLVGEEDGAMELYKEICAQPEPPVDIMPATHAVTNQAAPYEDVDLWTANAALRDALAWHHPGHDRARMGALGRSAGSAACVSRAAAR